GTGSPTAPRGTSRKPAVEAPTEPPARELTPEEHLLALLLRYPEATLQPDTPAPARFTRSENRLILEAVTSHILSLPILPDTPLAVDRAALRAAVDPALLDQYDFLLAEADREPYIYPFALAGEVARRSRRLQEYNDRLWLQQYQMLLAEAPTDAAEPGIDRFTAARALDDIRPQLYEQTTPARSTVYRDSRD
ncbi:MAG: hypothetical protein M3Z04_25305, partial [Chloroflexota bacterium]|nr:hypothetical protein [Chloroflexota bacterium]